MKKWSIALFGASVILGMSTLSEVSHAAEVQAVAQSKVLTGVVLYGVNLRSEPSLSGKVLTLLKKGEQLTSVILANNHFYKVTTASGLSGYASSDPQYIQVSPVSQPGSVTQSATIISDVKFRTGPSTSSSVIRLLHKGETVVILETSGSYYFKVQASDGIIGYISASPEYVQAGTTTPSSGGGNAPSTGGGEGASTTPGRDQLIQKVFAVGRSYLGTPYEFGSNRNDNSTFDCSDFVRTAYKEATGVVLPTDSRQQGAWVKANRTPVYDIGSLQPGDLVFFMSYKGSSDAAYQGIDKSKETITHVAIYMGNNQILQTYSIASGGVRIDTLSASWSRRFLFGGNVLQ